MESVAAPFEQPPTAGEAVAGLLLSLLVPLIGFIVGSLWMARGGRGSVAAGAASLALACAGLGFWVAFTF
jgi:hypothetical protein